MKIRFLPPSPRAGQETHCDNAAGRTAILAGFAEEIRYSSAKERLAAEGQGSPNVAGNVDPNAVGVEWAVFDSDGSAFSIVRVCKKVGSTTTFYATPPDDAPPVIKQRFAELTNAAKNDPAEALAKAKREQAEYDERIKTARRY
jgi:hypothetical protein